MNEDVYTVTHARGTSVHDERHFTRRYVLASSLSRVIAECQRRGRIIRVELAS